MTDKTDQEKIEAAAESYSPTHDLEMCVQDGSLEGAHNAVVDAFKDAVAWRDKNPGPHVMALVEALTYYKQFSLLPPDIQLKERIGGGKAHEALATFEKETK